MMLAELGERRGLRRLGWGFRALGWAGVAWLAIYLVLGIGEVEGWLDALWFGGIGTVVVACILAAFGAGELLRLAADLAAGRR